jgi:hypothetical protein
LGGVLLLHDTQRGLTFVAVGMLSLLTIAVRNYEIYAPTRTNTRQRQPGYEAPTCRWPSAFRAPRKWPQTQ